MLTWYGLALVLVINAADAQRIAAKDGNVVSGGTLIKKVAPLYPAVARAAHIEGLVTLNAVIGKDGHIRLLMPVSGPAPLQDAAVQAVKQWVYEPFLLNGQPAEVTTPISVRFAWASQPEIITTQPGVSAPAAPTYTLPPPQAGRPRISGNILLTKVIRKIEPVYPSSAGLPSRSVVLRIVVSTEGKILEVEGIAGPEEMRSAAVEAVRQWEFEPYLIDGHPTTIEAVLTLHPGSAH